MWGGGGGEDVDKGGCVDEGGDLDEGGGEDVRGMDSTHVLYSVLPRYLKDHKDQGRHAFFSS